ncbi:hypothetical protein D3C72_2371270 [compost metagenome]
MRDLLSKETQIAEVARVASAFHVVWTGGELNTLVPELRRLYITTEDHAALRWVTPRGVA